MRNLWLIFILVMGTQHSLPPPAWLLSTILPARFKCLFSSTVATDLPILTVLAMRCKWESGMCFFESFWLPGKRDKQGWLLFPYFCRGQARSRWWNSVLVTIGYKPKRKVVAHYWAVQTMQWEGECNCWLSFLLLTVQQILIGTVVTKESPKLSKYLWSNH